MQGFVWKYIRVEFLLDAYQFLGAENIPCTSEALLLSVIAHRIFIIVAVLGTPVLKGMNLSGHGDNGRLKISSPTYWCLVTTNFYFLFYTVKKSKSWIQALEFSQPLEQRGT